MRLTRLFAVCLVIATASIATIVSCGGGGSKGGVDANGNIDSSGNNIDAPGQVTNALGQLCPFATGGGGTECPVGNACVTVTGVGSNANTGYCTPDCMNSTAICATGYTGPAGGVPRCALTTGSGSSPDGCAIECTANPQCPTGMTCTLVPGQQTPIKICVPT